MRQHWVVWLGLSLSGGACYSAPPETSSAPLATTTVTFHRDVEPILKTRCQSCHVEGGIAPFPLVTYEDAHAHKVGIVTETTSRTMPPWGARTTAECAPPHRYVGDPQLTDDEIARLRAWSEGGAPRGNPSDAPSVPPSLPASLEGADSFKPSKGFVAQGDTDTLRCFVLDPKLDRTRYLNGTHFVPGNVAVVHHALTFAIPPGAAVPADEYECFGGPHVDDASLIAAWAPGGLPVTYPPNVGLPLEPGTRFVMQVHYHPHERASLAPDATTFQVRLTDTPPEYVVITRLIGNFRGPLNAEGTGLLPGPNDDGPVDFRVPPDAKGHVETMRFVVPERVGGRRIPELRVLGVGAHMHLVAVDQKITLTPAGGGPEACLLHDNAWNFGWQRGYQFDAPIDRLPIARPGDRIDVRCTYDNTRDNSQLAPALAEQRLSSPAEVRLGESTLDEMCIGSFSFVVKARP